MTTLLTDENFEKEVSNSDKLVLVDFFATWCEPCTMLAPILEKVAEDLKDKIILLKANLDDIPKTAGKFGVEKIPTVILFKSGKPISGFVGLSSEQSIKEWLENSSKEQQIVSEQDIASVIERYDNYAKSNGFRLNPDKKTVERVVKGLFENQKKYGKKYCPCRRVSGDQAEDAKKICPCAFHKDEIEKDGHCFCNLFVK
ncbi:MAG: thioredoxin [Candidatus Staskawiczbacteria bacterium RIFCSPLOWO2_01_FULL_37_25b]|uniref:Thioredoxin n=2 Tax=Candidatus Staskawicziibacteriota TaxID=1817916 RepID=A0A1G2HSS1_9BACT|nr:MAG: thioredoxin [Candidatus Staskawiczbacteria bacterium RIFCSPHIGHO2_01_FULL_36_16]OGZ74263.1 MAG: thioredoxin [Candidatus Staskawiczbacteria bacterium RIFCSPLOWO2_01_FULL_37_25b]